MRQLHKDIALIRDNEITESLYKETIGEGRKNVVKLENRLDVITKRCGSVMAENAKLREIIDHMLQERLSHHKLDFTISSFHPFQIKF